MRRTSLPSITTAACADPASVLRWMNDVLDMGEAGRIDLAEAKEAVCHMAREHLFAVRVPKNIGTQGMRSQATYGVHA